MSQNPVILYENRDGSLCARMPKGTIKKVPKPRFRHGEFVRRIDRLSASFTTVIEPRWTEDRGWTYGQKYISREGIEGGYSFSWEEKCFEPLENPHDILIAKKLSLVEEISKLENRLKDRNAQLEKINFALEIIKSNRPANEPVEISK